MELGIFFSILRISYKYLCIMEVLILKIFIIEKMFHSSKCVIMYNILQYASNFFLFAYHVHYNRFA